MNTRVKAVCGATLLALTHGVANAVELDFAQWAIDNGEQGVADGTIIQFGDLYVEFNAGTGGGDNLTTNAFAYFDGPSGGKPGGLGVCKVLDTNNQCVPSSDDNITGSADGILSTDDEWVTLTFWNDAAGTDPRFVTFGGLSFRSAQHDLILAGSVNTLRIDDVATTFGAAIGNTWVDIQTIKFGWGGDNPLQFYLNATVIDVPEPAALLLMGSGLALGGLVATRRRRRMV